MSQEFEITTMSEKGQLAIPRILREKMEIKADTKLIVMREGNAIVIRVLPPDMEGEWNSIFEMMDSKQLRISDSEIASMIKKHREEKRT